MARPGQVIENLATGEHVRFIQTKVETGGSFIEFALRLAPGGVVGGLPHKHLVGERFTAHRGRPYNQEVPGSSPGPPIVFIVREFRGRGDLLDPSDKAAARPHRGRDSMA